MEHHHCFGEPDLILCTWALEFAGLLTILMAAGQVCIKHYLAAPLCLTTTIIMSNSTCRISKQMVVIENMKEKQPTRVPSLYKVSAAAAGRRCEVVAGIFVTTSQHGFGELRVSRAIVRKRTAVITQSMNKLQCSLGRGLSWKYYAVLTTICNGRLTTTSLTDLQQIYLAGSPC